MYLQATISDRILPRKGGEIMYVGRRMTMRAALKEYKGKSLVIEGEHRATDGTILDAVVVSALSKEDECNLDSFPDGCKVLYNI